MTREEAIEILKDLWRTKHSTYLEGDIRKALEMAIQALEQEPSGDLISREELLKAIDTWDRFGVDDTNSLFRLDNLSLPHYVAYIHYDDVVKCIKGLPSVAIPPAEPREVLYSGDGYADGEMVYDMAECPNCGREFEYDYETWNCNFCPDCGQALKWEGEDE